MKRRFYIRCRLCSRLDRVDMPLGQSFPPSADDPRFAYLRGPNCCAANEGKCDWRDVTGEVRAACCGQPLEFLHPSDPEAEWNAFRVPYAYMHNEAERVLEETQRNNDWRWEAPDLFVPSQPIEIPGIYFGSLYGRDAMLVIIWNRGVVDPDILCGRGSLISDKEAVRHCLEPNNWG
jgi:hypothetical protein